MFTQTQRWTRLRWNCVCKGDVVFNLPWSEFFKSDALNCWSQVELEIRSGKDVHLSNWSGTRLWWSLLTAVWTICWKVASSVQVTWWLSIVNNSWWHYLKRFGRLTSKLATSITAFLVSTDTVIRSPEKIFGTDSSPNMSWGYSVWDMKEDQYMKNPPGEVRWDILWNAVCQL